ncbi:hypothetical protein [Lapillicoccus sp.]|uniref:hypothetical protein n=1 Tax=Lapillicoccus sp. TaxID=1909287 RepID=UPI0025DBD3BD|nr:hypothetical protein [Lapillicoccus sp.]
MVAFAQQDGAGAFVDWGVLHVSVTNIAIVGAMLLLFVLALVLPFPGHGHAAVTPLPVRVDPSPDSPDKDV